jgi:pimeloyl-ACP methyl ester carboxylesterase
MDTMNETYKRQFTLIDSQEVAVRSTTFSFLKKTVLLIHGIGTSSDYFLPLMEQLSVKYNVFALDLPGYGTTVKPPKALTIDELANIALTFLANNNLTNVIVAGHSMGGQIVARMNKINSERINKVILLSPTVNHNERTVILQALRLLQDSFFEPPKANFIIFLNYARMGPLRFFKTSQYMVNSHLEDALDNTQTPHLIIRGEKDHIVPRDWLVYLKKLSPNISTKEVLNAPHAFHYLNAMEVKDLCQVFIED